MTGTGRNDPSADPGGANDGTKIVGYACAGMVIVLFSGFTLLSRFGMQTGLSMLDLAALRFGIGGLLLLPIFLRYGRCGLTVWQTLLLALSGGLGFALCAYGGFLLAPAAHGSVLLHGTLPLSTLVLIWLSSRTVHGHGSLVGYALIAAGVLAMVGDSLTGATGRQLAGDGLLLAASLSWSFYGLMAKQLGLRPINAAAMVAVVSMLAFLPVYAVIADGTLFSTPWREVVVQAVFQGVLIGVVSIFVYTQAVHRLGASATATFTAAVPCVTTVAAIPMLSEWPTLGMGLGVAAVTVGLLIAVRRPSRQHS